MSSTQKATCLSQVEKVQAKIDRKKMRDLEMQEQESRIKLQNANMNTRLSVAHLDISIAQNNLKTAKQTLKGLCRKVSKDRADLLRRRYAVSKNNNEIFVAELELVVAEAIEKRKEEKKTNATAIKKLKKGVITDKLLQQVNKLPEVIVDIIREYLPYEVRIADLHLTATPQKLISRCNGELKRDLLIFYCATRQYLALIPYEEAVKHIRYHDGYKVCATVKEAEIRLLHLFEMATGVDPHIAFNMLKKLHFLIDPTKKYKAASNILNPFRPLTMNDLYATEIEYEIPLYN